MKTIIAIYGRKNEGKSETIKNVCRILLSNFPNSVPSIPIHEIDYNSDILLTIKLGSTLIGIESQGDPNSRMINDDTIKDLANQNCDICDNSILKFDMSHSRVYHHSTFGPMSLNNFNIHLIVLYAGVSYRHFPS